MEPNREMNSEEERRLKMRKVDSEVCTVRRDLINPPNLRGGDGSFFLQERLHRVLRDLILPDPELHFIPIRSY